MLTSSGLSKASCRNATTAAQMGPTVGHGRRSSIARRAGVVGNAGTLGQTVSSTFRRVIGQGCFSCSRSRWCT